MIVWTCTGIVVGLIFAAYIVGHAVGGRDVAAVRKSLFDFQERLDEEIRQHRSDEYDCTEQIAKLESRVKQAESDSVVLQATLTEINRMAGTIQGLCKGVAPTPDEMLQRWATSPTRGSTMVAPPEVANAYYGKQ